VAPPVAPAVSLSDAAKALGVTPQRVNQMLASGELHGPDIGSGRAAKNIGRVYEWSIHQELALRSAAPTPATPPSRGRQSLEARVLAVEQRLGTLSADETRALLNRERAARNAAQQFKVFADIAHDELMSERERTLEMSAENARLQAVLAQTQRMLASAERRGTMFGDSLTELLSDADSL
jgi:hypothetical protein